MKQSIIKYSKIWRHENKDDLNDIIKNMEKVAAILDMNLKDDSILNAYVDLRYVYKTDDE